MIAISYRREDSLSVAGRLYDRLQAEFGRGNVFMDFDSIPYGVDFREHIKQMVDESKVVLAMIGPGWAGKGKQRTRRIDDPEDFVRLEIAYALQRGIPVIPVLINDTQMPKATELPKEIEALAFRNAVTLHAGIDFHHHVDRLVGGIHRLVIASAKPAIRKDPSPSVRPAIETPFASGLFQQPHPLEPSTPRIETLPAVPQKPRPSQQPKRPPPLPVSQQAARTPGHSEPAREIPTRQAPPQKAVWLTRLQMSIARVQEWIARSQFSKRTLIGGAGGLLAIIVAIATWYFGFHLPKEVGHKAGQQSITKDGAPIHEQEMAKTPIPPTSTSTPTLTLQLDPRSYGTPKPGFPSRKTAESGSTGIPTGTLAVSRSELEGLYGKAFREFDVNNFSEALKDLDAIDARQPDLAESQNLRGVILMRQGIYDKAETALMEALRIDPKFWNARFNLAEIPFLKKDWAEARKRFQELLSSNASELEGDASQLIQYKILLTYLLENKENMVDSILARFELSPDTPAVHYANAAIALQRKNTKEAKDWMVAAEKNFSPQLNKLFVESLYEVGWLEKPAGQTRVELDITKTTTSPSLRNNRSWQVWIDEFVKKYVSTTDKDVDAVLAFYASKVLYFDHQEKDQAFIRIDVEKYRERWPIRRESIEGDILIQKKSPDREYRANFALTFYAESSSRGEWSKGQSAVELEIVIVDGVPKISAIKQTISQRQKGATAASPPSETKRNSFGIIEGKYVCQYLAASKTKQVGDRSTRESGAATITYGSQLIIKGPRFSHLFQLDQQPNAAGARKWPRLRYTIRTDGNIAQNGVGVFLLQPDQVEVIDKFPKNLSDSSTSIARERQRLPTTKWIVRHEENRLVQTSNSETWTLENPSGP